MLSLCDALATQNNRCNVHVLECVWSAFETIYRTCVRWKATHGIGTAYGHQLTSVHVFGFEFKLNSDSSGVAIVQERCVLFSLNSKCYVYQSHYTLWVAAQCSFTCTTLCVQYAFIVKFITICVRFMLSYLNIADDFHVKMHYKFNEIDLISINFDIQMRQPTTYDHNFIRSMKPLRAWNSFNLSYTEI